MYCKRLIPEEAIEEMMDMGYFTNLNEIAGKWFNRYNKGLNERQFKELVRNCESFDVDVEDVIDRIHEFNLY